jgi:hypothetical protein
MSNALKVVPPEYANAIIDLLVLGGWAVVEP